LSEGIRGLIYSTIHAYTPTVIIWLFLCLRLGLHWLEYESGYLRTGFSKHEFACIPIVAIHNNMGLVYKYLEIRAVFVYSSSFLTLKQQKQTPATLDVNNYVIIMVQVM